MGGEWEIRRRKFSWDEDKNAGKMTEDCDQILLIFYLNMESRGETKN